MGFCLRWPAIQVHGIPYHKSNDSLILGVIFEIIYYLCRMYGIQRLRKNPQRVACRKAGTFEPVIYADYPVHKFRAQS